MSYKKILVAIDRSPQADIVFENALKIAEHQNAALMVCHCMPVEDQGSSLYTLMYGMKPIDFSKEIQAQLKQERDEARQWLAGYVHKASAKGVSTEWKLKVGTPGKEIRELASTWNADLVVVGRRGRGRRRLTRLVLGSVSNHIVHHMRCSVLVVQSATPSNVAQV